MTLEHRTTNEDMKNDVHDVVLLQDKLSDDGTVVLVLSIYISTRLFIDRPLFKHSVFDAST
jgi:hypothetical protein